MTENRSPTEGTIRDIRPGEPLDGGPSPRMRLSVLNVSHERFRIVKTYARGGLGVVSIAQDIELDRMVAIKEMRMGRPSDDDIQRFLLEARLTGQLDHPGIPPVYALGYFEDGRPFYAMRLIEGVTLRDAIKDFHAKYPAPDRSRQRSMQLRQLIGAIVSVCNTLRFAHSNGVLHRDIKPSNIMLGEYGETLLMDWGLAKSQRQSLPYSELEAKAHQPRKRPDDPEDTGTGSVMGTPPYMSPEQAVGDVESINQRSEVYSVGATLYSVLTGEPAFRGDTRDEVLEKVRRGDFLPPRSVDSRVPPELNAICLKAMSLERGDRYADTGELAIDIEHWLADESVSCYREPQSRRWQRWARAHQAWVAGLAALMFTCFVGLLIGGYLVSRTHADAVASRREAESAANVAQAVTEQSRELISRSFIATFNDRIKNIPGTEQTRLDILQMFIDQFENWSNSAPNNFRDRHELAVAIHERAQIHLDLNERDLAWADMLYALRVFDDLQQAPDPVIHGTSLLDRFNLMSDMAAFMNEFEPDAELGEAFAQRMYYVTVREADRIGGTCAYQAHLGAALSQMALAKSKRGQANEAFELACRACDSIENLLTPQKLPVLKAEIHGGGNASILYAVQCHHELAHMANQWGDEEFVARQIMTANKLLDQFDAEFERDFDFWLAKRANQLNLTRYNVGKRENSARRSQVTRIANDLTRALSTRPAHRPLIALRFEALIMLAHLSFFEGDLDDAQSHALDALCLSLESQPLRRNVFADRQRLNLARDLVVDIANCRGDIATAQLHQYFECDE